MNPLMFTGLFYEYAGIRRWRLTKPLFYFLDSGTIVVPAGFITDMDSVPRIPVVYAAFKGRTVKSAVIHDYLYENQRGKAFADRVFLRAMRDEGVPARWRYPIYWAVAVFGGAIYQGKPRSATS